MSAVEDAKSDENYPRPWSSRSPQRWVFAAVAVALAVAVVIAAVGYISRGQGGIVPYLMIAGGPALGAYYVWYFAIRKWT